MKPHLMTGLGLAVSILALSGCMPMPAPQAMVVPPPVPPPVAVIASAPVVLVPAPPPPPVMRRHIVHVTHRVTHHPVHRRYATHVYYAPIGTRGCGSTVAPCNVEHLTAPVQ